MKNIFFLIFIFLFPLISFAQPTIVFTEESHDIGAITQGTKIEHTFVFKNEGNEELVIQRLAPS